MTYYSQRLAPWKILDCDIIAHIAVDALYNEIKEAGQSIHYKEFSSFCWKIKRPIKLVAISFQNVTQYKRKQAIVHS